MHTLENNKLKISINNIGAELSKIASVKNNTEFMWHADRNIWGSSAPNLFPIIGALKDDTYVFENKAYKLPKHGFVRHNQNMILHEETKNSLTFRLVSDEDLLTKYPFHFEFFITYTLSDNNLEIKHIVKNTDDKTMYFSVGGHPAFKCPTFKYENYDDYYLEFDQVENSKRHFINMDKGLISDKTELVFNNSNKLPLTHDLFLKDALVFKDITSRKIRLMSEKSGPILSVNFKGFPYLGIWAKPDGDFICIEPWLGIADSENTNQNLVDKEGVLSLEANKTFLASYNIEIDNTHLA
jgi:galactose mutarotase-like enzyme